jgi:hypothetical protein
MLTPLAMAGAVERPITRARALEVRSLKVIVRLLGLAGIKSRSVDGAGFIQPVRNGP